MSHKYGYKGLKFSLLKACFLLPNINVKSFQFSDNFFSEYCFIFYHKLNVVNVDK